MTDLLSVVIPSIGRPTLAAAIESVFNQVDCTLELEIIVIIAKADCDWPWGFGQTNVRRVVTEARMNGNQARNAGVAAARGQFVAFLDDDDIWKPQKIKKQSAAILDPSTNWLAVSAVQTFNTVNNGSAVFPDVSPDAFPNIRTYMLRRDSLRSQPRWFQTSTWFAPITVFQQFPFDEGVVVHQDIDWILRNEGHIEIRYDAAPQVDYRTEPTRKSEPFKAAASLRWIQAPELAVAPELQMHFITTVTSRFSAEAGRPWLTLRLLLRGYKIHRPAPLLLLLGAVRLSSSVVVNARAKRDAIARWIGGSR